MTHKTFSPALMATADSPNQHPAWRYIRRAMGPKLPATRANRNGCQSLLGAKPSSKNRLQLKDRLALLAKRHVQSLPQSERRPFLGSQSSNMAAFVWALFEFRSLFGRAGLAWLISRYK